MRWIRKTDKFVLTRDEFSDFVLFCTAWMHEPKSERPTGYDKFHMSTIWDADRLLMKYLKYDKALNKILKKELERSIRVR